MNVNFNKCDGLLNAFLLDMQDIFDIVAQLKHTLFVQIFNLQLTVSATVLYFLNLFTKIVTLEKCNKCDTSLNAFLLDMQDIFDISAQ